MKRHMALNPEMQRRRLATVSACYNILLSEGVTQRNGTECQGLGNTVATQGETPKITIRA